MHPNIPKRQGHITLLFRSGWFCHFSCLVFALLFYFKFFDYFSLFIVLIFLGKRFVCTGQKRVSYFYSSSFFFFFFSSKNQDLPATVMAIWTCLPPSCFQVRARLPTLHRARLNTIKFPASSDSGKTVVDQQSVSHCRDRTATATATTTPASIGSARSPHSKL